jgi:hypothetical protein
MGRTNLVILSLDFIGRPLLIAAAGVAAPTV